MQNKYNAHYRSKDDCYQTLSDHSRNVADLAEYYCQVPLLKKAVWLAGIYHDAGKATDSWQRYFERSIHEENYVSDKEDHSTIGGMLLLKKAPGKRVSVLAENAIYMHHGMRDCVSVRDGSCLAEKRRHKYTAEAIEAVQAEFSDMLPEPLFEKIVGEAEIDLRTLMNRIWKLTEKSGNASQHNGENQQDNQKDGQKERYGNRDFYLGMCERLLLSCLMDADWRDTADFMENIVTDTSISEDEIQQIWSKGIAALERKISGFSCERQMDHYRAEISGQCQKSAYCPCNLYRLAVPTGAGKTLSSLRFALHHAKEYRKRHIFYVAPFRSILEQNAKVIREAFGMPDAVLEHHGDVVQETGGERNKYERLIENWDESPVIVTTAVQFFDTIFKEKRSNIRRFHSLCNSVIVMDEVQALPIKLVYLMNLAVNFLTQFCDSTVVLCTATQPLFEEVPCNKMLPMANMTDSLSVYEKHFRRVEYNDCTQQCGDGLSVEGAAEFVRDKAERFDRILMIVNTKACARELYKALEGKVEGELFHLSNAMCPEHRAENLTNIRAALEAKRKVICISTQLVEAGVDFSFQCVIRSLAGLDNLIQAAGRCNRNGDSEMGQVYLIKMSGEAENVSRIPDIRKAQEALKRLLNAWHACPENYDSRMDSEKAIKYYYRHYFYSRMSEMVYNVKVDAIPTNMVDLLSKNTKFSDDRKILLKQAFETAGEMFHVIDEMGGREVIVIYKGAKQAIERLEKAETMEKRRLALRNLQRYSVKVTDRLIQNLGNAVYGIDDNRILVLNEVYYNENVGVQEEPSEMEFLSL